MTSDQIKAMRERSGRETSKDPLVDFLYHLMRDHLPVGTVEGIVSTEVEAYKGQTSVYTNGWLAQYAKDIADRLKL